MDPNGPGPAFQQRPAEAGQRVPALQPEARLPRRRLKVERHEEHQPQQRQPQPPPQQVSANQQPRQQRPQRHAHRADRRREAEGVQHESEGSEVHGGKNSVRSTKYRVARRGQVNKETAGHALA